MRLEHDGADRRHLSADRTFAFTEAAALAYGEIMDAAQRRARPMQTADDMTAASARVNGGHLATRNPADFEDGRLRPRLPVNF